MRSQGFAEKCLQPRFSDSRRLLMAQCEAVFTHRILSLSVLFLRRCRMVMKNGELLGAPTYMASLELTQRTEAKVVHSEYPSELPLSSPSVSSSWSSSSSSS